MNRNPCNREWYYNPTQWTMLPRTTEKVSAFFSTQIVAPISIDQFSNKGEKERIWKILLRNDRNKSQHRRIKKQRRYERLGSRRPGRARQKECWGGWSGKWRMSVSKVPMLARQRSTRLPKGVMQDQKVVPLKSLLETPCIPMWDIKIW